MELTVSPETLVQSASQSQEGFRHFLEETERLQIFHNPAFSLYSEPNETREQFLQRCQDETKRLLGNEQERLESTFRRRIDQLRERSDRERRTREEEEGDQHDEAREMNVAWGQALYNITSGRPAAVADAPKSARDVDYLDNIAQIQRAWDRELQALREELERKAREIEEMALVPTEKDIEITRFLILWAAGLPA